MNTEITDARGAVLRAPAFSGVIVILCLPLLLAAAFPISALVLPRWILMWIIAFSLFALAKVVTWGRAARRGAHPSLSGAFGYLLAWPGMDAGPFVRPAVPRGQRHVTRPREWWIAGGKAVLGLSLFVTAAICADRPTLWAGWLGMIGLVLFLHFGLFHLLALAWRASGREVKPIMDRPLVATSVAEFWGSRWNNAFSKLANDLVFRPLSRRAGVGKATAAVFLLSGLVHEAVISVPAGGGYGLPTAYFMLEGLCVLLERTEWFRKLGFGAGFWGQLLVLACVGGPAFWLFHPKFVYEVIVPMLRAFVPS